MYFQTKLRTDFINENDLYFSFLSSNINAISILEANPDKIQWYYLAYNENAIHLLEANPDKINWDNL